MSPQDAGIKAVVAVAASVRTHQNSAQEEMLENPFSLRSVYMPTEGAECIPARAGRMVLTVLGAVAELERSLIVERVKAGLRNAKAKGKRLGRPRVIVDARRIGALRASGSSWAEITRQTGWTKGTVQRAYYDKKASPALPKNA